jgi:hypothetical protein
MLTKHIFAHVVRLTCGTRWLGEFIMHIVSA